MGQAKNEEIAMGRAVVESGGDCRQFGRGHAWGCGIRGGGVVEEGGGDRGWEKCGGG